MMLLGNPYAYFRWRRGYLCQEPVCARCAHIWNHIVMSQIKRDAYHALLRNETYLERYKRSWQPW